MLKIFSVLIVLISFLSCRKDPVVSVNSIPNPCDDTTEPYCLFPNPVHDSVSIFISLPEHGKVNMVYFDRYGHEVAQILDSSLVKGNHLFLFDATILPFGLNVCKIEFSNELYWAKIIKL
jgi:hypothetical protein